MAENEKPAIDEYDSIERWRCPQLGGEITFGYCRRMNEGVPCHHLYTCWQETLNVDEYVKKNFTPEEIKKAFETQPRGRVGTIFDVLYRLQEEQKQS